MFFQYALTHITVVHIYIGKFQRDITPTKFRQSKFPGYMHNRILCPYYLPSFMKFCSVVSKELCWQTVTNRTKTICLPIKVGRDIIRTFLFLVSEAILDGDLGLWCLMPLSTIFQLYCGSWMEGGAVRHNFE